MREERGDANTTRAIEPERRCLMCGASLQKQRRDARCCSARCRRELGRWRAVSAGREDGPYRTLSDLQNRRQRRVCTPLTGSQVQPEDVTGTRIPTPERSGA
jgi:hypothetical protein